MGAKLNPEVTLGATQPTGVSRCNPLAGIGVMASYRTPPEM
jgi:hypothetical protein